MKIHKGFLTHDATTGGAGKVLDLGFNGDFDYKNHTWNMLFVQIPSREGAYDEDFFPVTVMVKTADTLAGVASGTFATLTIPWNASYAKGGVAFFPMPKGLKRYFTMAITSADGGDATYTAGITDGEDTVVTPGMNWTYYNADTSTSEVKGIMSEAMERLFSEEDPEEDPEEAT